MGTAAGRSGHGALRRVPASAVLAGQAVLALVTALAAWLAGWQIAVVGLALMQLVSVLATVGPWGAPPPPVTVDVNVEELSDLERRVDAMSTRLVAGTERLRVEVLDALAEARSDHEERVR